MVKILKSDKGHHYGGLMTCGSVWVCPVCASKITERKREDLVQGVNFWLAGGHGVYMLTLTVPHYFRDSAQVVLDGISDALRRMFNRGTWKGKPETTKKPFRPGLSHWMGYIGRVRTLEVTHGVNGWHPHFHLLLFLQKPISAIQMCFFQEDILLLWQSACMAAGLPCPNEHGCTLADGSHAARYATKWGIENEMAKGHLKVGKKGGEHYGPFALLQLVADGDRKAPFWFREYAATFSGKRQLVWSDGLRDLLGLGAELDDEELASVEVENASPFADLPLNVWQVVLREDMRGELLQVCSGGLDALYDWIINLMETEITTEHIIRDLGGVGIRPKD